MACVRVRVNAKVGLPPGRILQLAVSSALAVHALATRLPRQHCEVQPLTQCVARRWFRRTWRVVTSLLTHWPLCGGADSTSCHVIFVND